MPIDFEDEGYFKDEDEGSEFPDGLDVVKAYMGSGTTSTDAEPSMSPVNLSEQPRDFITQRATVSNRSPSPMDVDSGPDDMRAIEGRELIYPGHAIINTTTTMKPSARSSARSTTVATAQAIPSKRTTSIQDPSGPFSVPPSPSALPQPAKRPHTNAHTHVNPAVNANISTTATATAPTHHHAGANAANGAPNNRVPVVSEFGQDLAPFVIAHDPSAQALLDAGQLAWGTVYEIARGITKQSWTWSSVTKEKVEQLRGNNVQGAPNVIAVIRDGAGPAANAFRGRGNPAAEVWGEYDREQDAIIENKGRGLGGQGPWKGKDDWYGGRIQQVGRLIRCRGKFAIQLEKPEIRRSHRFSRFLGSRRILQVRVANDMMFKHGEDVRSLLSKSKFILCGRVFLPFHAKEGSVYLLETSQDYERVGQRGDGDHYRMSLRDFINWHNPPHLNSNQPISKWSTRWALGLSTSVPTIVFEPQNIIYEIPDEYVSPKDWEGKAPAEKVLTDGCGFINGAALTQIMWSMKYGSRPTAVQGRIAGSKGMWVLHPDPREQVADGPAKIWIRPSQTKIKLEPASSLGPAQRMFDLLAPSRVSTPSRLSAQTLINLSHNGIQDQVLRELMALGMREEIRPFVELESESMVMVWKAVERAGSVTMSRLRRILAGKARALGLGQLRPVDNQDVEEEEEEDGILDSTGTSHKRFSQHPLTLHETVLELLQVGFHPLKLSLLFKKLESVITLVLDDYVEKFHIPVLESCEAYIVPDPYGVLEEGQIHLRLSEPIVSPSTGQQTDIILGEVLVSRNPTRLPSDIQRVQAVAHPKLSNYFNVIVFPIKGKQSLASFLGGGDYDGDTVMVNWYKPLVEQFRGSSFCGAPTNLSEFFEREVEQVRDFDKRVSKMKSKEAQEDFQKVLLLGLAETRVGLYSKFHDAAVYEFGYGDQQAIHLAYMFTTCLDGSKTGLRVRENVFLNDRQDWGPKKPWYAWRLEQRKNNAISKSFLKRGDDSPPFILDVLVKEAERLRDQTLEEYGKLRILSVDEDEDLYRPWKEAKEKAAHARMQGFSGFGENLEDIEHHVNVAYGEYQRAATLNRTSPQHGVLFDRVASFFSDSPKFRGFVFFSDDDVQMLKASLAFTKSISFAFSVAFHTLCTIKARAHAGGHVTIAQQFAQCMTVPNLVSRMLSQLDTQDDDT